MNANTPVGSGSQVGSICFHCWSILVRILPRTTGRYRNTQRIPTLERSEIESLGLVEFVELGAPSLTRGNLHRYDQPFSRCPPRRNDMAGGRVPAIRANSDDMSRLVFADRARRARAAGIGAVRQGGAEHFARLRLQWSASDGTWFRLVKVSAAVLRECAFRGGRASPGPKLECAADAPHPAFGGLHGERGKPAWVCLVSQACARTGSL